MKKPAVIISILLFVIFSLSMVRIYISNNVATSGVMLEKVQNALTSVKLENIILSQKLYTESSLTDIADKAQSQGYIESKTDFVINGQLPVAFKQ